MFLMIKSHDMANRNGYNWSCLSGKNPKPRRSGATECCTASQLHCSMGLKAWCSNDYMHTFKLKYNYIILIKHAARHTNTEHIITRRIYYILRLFPEMRCLCVSAVDG